MVAKTVAAAVVPLIRPRAEMNSSSPPPRLAAYRPTARKAPQVRTVRISAQVVPIGWSPFAGMIQSRFNGCDLSPRTPSSADGREHPGDVTEA